MVYDRALGIYTTGSGTRVTAFFIGTRLAWWTFEILCTFWSASRWTSNVTGNAGADSVIIIFTTLAIWTAW